ncbi:MAG: YfbM family protein [Proteobacteria bacterium]|nr:YfbM family protein [Pseudomonadota bacterium]
MSSEPRLTCRVHRATSVFVALVLIGFSLPCLAGLEWCARAIDPSQIEKLKHNQKLLERTVFGEQPQGLDEQIKKDGYLSFSDPKVRAAMEAAVAANKPDDTWIDLNDWHGIHYLLTGRADPDGSVASKVIMGGAEIGKDTGTGRAQVLMPEEVKVVAQLLQKTTPDVLRSHFNPQEMTRLDIYPKVVWERDGEMALGFLLEEYQRLVAFYARAADRGQAVVWAVTD